MSAEGKSAEWARANCHMLARREIRRLQRELTENGGTGMTAVTVVIGTWQHIIRICEKAGYQQSGVLREAEQRTAEGAASECDCDQRGNPDIGMHAHDCQIHQPKLDQKDGVLRESEAQTPQRTTAGELLQQIDKARDTIDKESYVVRADNEVIATVVDRRTAMRELLFIRQIARNLAPQWTAEGWDGSDEDGILFFVNTRHVIYVLEHWSEASSNGKFTPQNVIRFLKRIRRVSPSSAQGITPPQADRPRDSGFGECEESTRYNPFTPKAPPQEA